MLVEEIMHRQIHSITPATSIGDAIHLLKKHRIRHLPVLDGEDLVGLVTDRDLRGASPSSLDPEGVRWQDLLHRPVSKVMIRQLITAHPLDFVEDAARLLYEHRVGCLPILQGEKLVGILTATDILHRLIEIFGVDHPGQHVEVEVEDRFGILAEVAAIFGDHRININSVLLEKSPKKHHLKLVFRVQAKDLGKIIDNIKQAGHRVLWPRTTPHPEGGV
ncbi:acetoin utilization protein AcuB [Kroppenstedtia sanguinis]|uniref:CBS and ACT domain-containing protein n=1 Tax=Kroppenstedtia sanguinis TaxID=1380684 RepID=A0ABW4CF54_9BACL